MQLILHEYSILPEGQEGGAGVGDADYTSMGPPGGEVGGEGLLMHRSSLT